MDSVVEVVVAVVGDDDYDTSETNSPELSGFVLIELSIWLCIDSLVCKTMQDETLICFSRFLAASVASVAASLAALLPAILKWLPKKIFSNLSLYAFRAAKAN